VPPGPSVPLGQGLQCVLTGPQANWVDSPQHLNVSCTAAGAPHIVNMWFLSLGGFGNNIEDRWGTRAFVVFLSTRAVCGRERRRCCRSQPPVSPMIGASGAITGDWSVLVLYPGCGCIPHHPPVFLFCLHLRSRCLRNVIRLLVCAGSCCSHGGRA